MRTFREYPLEWLTLKQVQLFVHRRVCNWPGSLAFIATFHQSRNQNSSTVKFDKDYSTNKCWPQLDSGKAFSSQHLCRHFANFRLRSMRRFYHFAPILAPQPIWTEYESEQRTY